MQLNFGEILNLALKGMCNVWFECVYNTGEFKFCGLLRNRQTTKFLYTWPRV